MCVCVCVLSHILESLSFSHKYQTPMSVIGFAISILCLMCEFCTLCLYQHVLKSKIFALIYFSYKDCITPYCNCADILKCYSDAIP